jgi:hypothetical protein
LILFYGYVSFLSQFGSRIYTAMGFAKVRIARDPSLTAVVDMMKELEGMLDVVIKNR